MLNHFKIIERIRNLNGIESSLEIRNVKKAGGNSFFQVIGVDGSYPGGTYYVPEVSSLEEARRLGALELSKMTRNETRYRPEYRTRRPNEFNDPTSWIHEIVRLAKTANGVTKNDLAAAGAGCIDVDCYLRQNSVEYTTISIPGEPKRWFVLG